MVCLLPPFPPCFLVPIEEPSRQYQAMLLGSRHCPDLPRASWIISISGLENPCHPSCNRRSMLWGYWRQRPRDPFWLTLIASLSAVNRMDSVLLYSYPPCCGSISKAGWRACLAGPRRHFLPFLAWEVIRPLLLRVSVPEYRVRQAQYRNTTTYRPQSRKAFTICKACNGVGHGHRS